jgi:DNA-binding NarL/FixJ family response regulator
MKRKSYSAADQSQYAGIPTGDMRLIAAELGPDVARKMMLKLGGLKLYIPKSSAYRKWHVETYFTGANHNDLALELGVTTSTINSYIKQMYNKPKPEEPRQQSLFG